MKKYIKSMALMFAALLAVGTLSSCEDYLDKDPDSDISEDTPFKNFNNLQGYVEEIYKCIPDKAKCYWTTAWNLGDDEIQNPQADWHMVHQMDLGNYFGWQGNSGFWFGKEGVNTSGDAFAHGLYGHAWYCIAKCNKALARIDQYFVGTQEEKDLILGQLYFFRAWWHFEMMEFLGGLPYIDTEFSPADTPNLKRLSYQECADKAAADFRKAADLLPINWDNTATGKNTVGHNDLRINKIMALGYLGKNYLWAASPLMQPKYEKTPPTDGIHTYEYNQDYARKAAEALGELLTLVQNGETQYELVGFKFSKIYDHVMDDGEENCYSDLFFTSNQGWRQPGSTEAIFRGPSNGWSYTRYNFTRLFGPNQLCAQDNCIHLPTANYVDNYGMRNGLPLPEDLSKPDPESGWDPEYPFRNRDPRFYHDIVFDGVRYINSEPEEADANMKYAGLATGGSMRAVSNASRTGYFYQKLVPHTCQKYDQGTADDYGPSPHSYIPYMRLADIYLMYAEATAAIGGPNTKASNCKLSSIDALNVLRKRCGAGNVSTKFTGNAYMDEVRRERAVELAFEGFRFNDLQRWLLLTVPKYMEKKSVEFIRLEDEKFFEKNDPAEAKVSEYREELILTRKYEAKHYWFPLYRDDTYIASEFEQNPGW